jgi:uncharacterized membrane protein YjdF
MSYFLNLLSVLIAIVVGYLYWMGLENHLFFYIWWYDIPLHMLAGLVVGLWGSALAWRRGVLPYQTLILVLLAAFAIGAMWEIFELWAGITRGDSGYWPDTLKDLFNDCTGGVFAVLIYWSLHRQRTING